MYRPYYMRDVYNASKQNKFTVVSLFAGGGGSSTGYRLAGGKVLAINEFVEEARRVYKINYPETPIIPDDIRNISGEDILRVAGIKKGELDILDGSPPCSSFSVAGLREKGWGKEKSYSDTCQVTDDLFFEFARVLKEVQPRFFIAENVKGITMGSAANLLGSEQLGLFGEHKDTIFHSLVNAGYSVRFRVLNSKYYGVPQSRERTIFVGVRNDIDFRYKYPLPTTKIPVTLREAFSHIDNTEQEIKDADISRFAVGKELRKLKIGEQSEKYFSLIKLNPDSYSGTLTQTAGVPSAASIAHWDNRKITVSEAKAIMGFPLDYYAGDTYREQIERLGRAVTPPLYLNVVNNLKF